MTKNLPKIHIVHSPSKSVIDSLQQIRDAFLEHGFEAAFLPLDDSTTKRVQGLISRGLKILCAAGGDGTQNAVAGMIRMTKVQLGVIPVGTLNHLAKDLNIPTDMQAAVACIVRGDYKQIDVGEVNGSIFLNNSSIGLYPRLVTHREKLEGTIGKWPAALYAGIRGLTVWRTHSVHIEIDGKAQRHHTPMVIIGNNSYHIDQPGITNRTKLTSGSLSVYLVKTTSRLRLVWIVLRSLAGRPERGQDFESHLAKSVTLTTRAPRVYASRDGEVDRLSSPLKYTIRPRQLKVIVPGEKS